MEKRTRSEAKKQYWATIPKEERSAQLRKIAFIKSQRMTIEEKRNHALIMVAARNNKKANI